jgi:penicillin-binding protein 2
VAKGLAVSCDVVYWQIAVQLNGKDPNILPNMAKGFGYGTKTGIVGLPSDEENPGFVPDPQWLRATKNAGWSPTDAANLAIGQGFFLATPLQIAVAGAAVANNGQRMQPRLVTSIVGVDGQTIASYPAKVLGTLPVSADHLAILQADMLGPTTDPSGTSYNVFNHFPVLVAGKTGTAESGQPQPHALYMAYAPASPASGPAVTPKIAIGTLVEYAHFGDYDAAPIVKDLIGLYLNV